MSDYLVKMLKEDLFLTDMRMCFIKTKMDTIVLSRKLLAVVIKFEDLLQAVRILQN